MVLHYGHFAKILKRDKNSTNVATVLPLKLRPTGLGAGIDKERPDFTVELGELTPRSACWREGLASESKR